MKQQYKDLLDNDKLPAFPLSSKIFDLGREAESVARVAQKRIDEEGEHAQIHCSNIVEWMNAIAENAQKALDFHLNQNANK
ncbi:MAG: hypothetical protein CME70_00975 [Halobacteriovorax sp.]|nr:hypothetical protein [Halobacteriovorax sp.]|tara:strand:- start:128 stop:370 length:243 start_codon:yes stop_codon:yes gene_type:complete